APEPTRGVVLLWRLVGCGTGPEGTGGGLILERGPSPPAAAREPLAVLHHEVDVMQRARHRRCGKHLHLFRTPVDLRHLGAVGERLAVAGNSGPVRVDHGGVREDRSKQVSVLTDGDNLPGLVSPELGEREPARHLHGVLVLSRHGAAADGTEECRRDSDRPHVFALHHRFLLCSSQRPRSERGGWGGLSCGRRARRRKGSGREYRARPGTTLPASSAGCYGASLKSMG